MDKPSSKLFAEASQLLDAYYRSVVTKVAEELVENRDELDLPYASRAEEIVDRYGHHLQSIARIQGDLMTMTSILSQQEGAAAGTMPGMPVAPSGRPICPDTALEVGAQILVEQGANWWSANVVATFPDGTVRVHYAGWDDSWDETVPRSRIQEANTDSTADERPSA